LWQGKVYKFGGRSGAQDQLAKRFPSSCSKRHRDNYESEITRIGDTHRMESRLGLLIALLLAAFQAWAMEAPSNYNQNSTESGLLRTVRHIYGQCAYSEDVFWCCKIQGVRLLGRALKVPQLGIVDGVSLVRRESFTQDTRSGRSSLLESQLSNRDLEHLSGKSLDALLLERFLNFVHSHQLQVNLPRLLRFGERNVQDWMLHVAASPSPVAKGSR